MSWTRMVETRMQIIVFPVPLVCPARQVIYIYIYIYM